MTTELTGNAYKAAKEYCAVCFETHRVRDGLCPRCRVEEPEVRLVTITAPSRGRKGSDDTVRGPEGERCA
jgi:hypothetical protein